MVDMVRSLKGFPAICHEEVSRNRSAATHCDSTQHFDDISMFVIFVSTSASMLKGARTMRVIVIVCTEPRHWQFVYAVTVVMLWKFQEFC